MYGPSPEPDRAIDFMQLTIREVVPNEIESVIPLLLLAEPSEGALRWGLSHLSDTVYRLDADGELVGAATMRWQGDPGELQELDYHLDPKFVSLVIIPFIDISIAGEEHRKGKANRPFIKPLCAGTQF